MLGDKLLFENIKAELVGGWWVGGRDQGCVGGHYGHHGEAGHAGVKWKFIVSCEQQEDSFLRGRDELLEESVASEEEPKLQNNSKDDLESQVEAALLNSGYVCTFATDVQKIKAAMFEENDSQVALITREENQKLSTDMLEENAALTTQKENQNLL